MGFSSFSGPLRVGPVNKGPASNAGLVVLSQSFDTGDLTGAEVGNIDTLAFRLPRGAQIVDIVVDQIEAAGDGTMTISVGTEAGGAELMAGVASTAGGRFRGTATAATQAEWFLTDETEGWVRVAVGTDTLTAGHAVVTVLYIQRAPDGAQRPASA